MNPTPTNNTSGFQITEAGIPLIISVDNQTLILLGAVLFGSILFAIIIGGAINRRAAK